MNQTEEHRSQIGNGASRAITPVSTTVMHDETELHVMARVYANSGLFVFPLAPRSKTPITPNGFKDATNDPDMVNHWWSITPNANIGLDCGRSKLVIIDVDPRNGGEESFRQFQKDLGRPLEKTVVVRTGGGGMHIWFAGFRPKGKFPKYNGIDIQANGGYVILPPSIHPNGNSYQFADDIGCGFFMDEALWTDDLDAFMAKEEYTPTPGGIQVRGDGHRYALAALRYELEILLNTREGGRNNQLNTSAVKIWGYVKSGLLPEMPTWDAFMDAGRSIGLTTVEVTKTLRSASGAARPRTGVPA